MPDSMSGAEKIPDEPKASCVPESKEVLFKQVKRQKNQAERTSSGQTCNNLCNKTNPHEALMTQINDLIINNWWERENSFVQKNSN